MISQEQILNAKILIVDDQKLLCRFLESLLNECGYKNIQYITDPLKTLTKTLDFKPDLLVLDLIMPHLDGFQVMEQLHSFREDHYLPVLVLSDDKGPDIRLRALEAGATDFMNKPYEKGEILFRIKNMIEMRLLHFVLENQNKILEIRVKERTKQLRETQLDIIRRLGQAAEFRDTDTGLHIVRMSQYCAKFAEEMGMDERDCDLLLHASPLHDVGKIGIPDRILLKPGPLTPDEFEIMKTHATIGAQLLSGSNSPIMQMAELIASTHHEKWDGTGYPHKLKGDEIPLIGQICSICDVFDALTSDRPYKSPWTTKEAVKEICKQKGKQFSPQIVDKFIKILSEIEEIKNQSQE